MSSSTDKTSDSSTGFWLRCWLDGDIGWHHEETNAHLLSHWHQLGVSRGSEVFVPLCGKSRDMAWLVQQGYSVIGVEISPKAVEEFFAEQQLTPVRSAYGEFELYQAPGYRLLCGDIYKLKPEHLKGVTAVYDRASLVALDPHQQQRYARLLADILPPVIYMLLVSMDYPENEMQGPPYSVPETEVRKLFGDSFKVSKLHTQDLLKDTDRYSDKGLSRLSEQIFKLDRLY